MWTALLLVIVVAGGSAAYGAWALHEVARGMPAWPFVVGYPVAYLAVPLLFAAFWFTLAWWFRARRPAGIGLAFAPRIAMFVGEFLALARSAPRMILYRWLIPRSAACEGRAADRLGARRRLQRRHLVPACGSTS